MSHFTVAVFTKEGQTVSELLAPYQENNMGSCPKEYLVFNETEDEYGKKYESETRKEFYCDSNSSRGQKVNSKLYDILKSHTVGEKFSVYIEKNICFGYFKKECNYKCYNGDVAYYPEEHIWVKVKDVCFDGMIEVELINPPKEIALKEYYNNNFELFMNDWVGYEKRDEENGKYGYWENPNAKWDWHQIGGRWSGLLELRSGATSGEYGKRSWTNKNRVISDNRVDSAKIKDIDFSLNENEYKENLRFWELIVEESTPTNDDEKEIVRNNYHKPEYYTQQYENKEQFAKLSTELSTYAVITPDGKWHSKGDMGWFGLSSESDEEAKQWIKSFKETFIDTADPEWTLTVVDCHI